MNPDFLHFLRVVIVFGMVTGTGAFWIWLRERRRTLPGADRVELAQLKQDSDHHAAALEEAQDTLASLTAQIAELQERVDFAERLLAQARDRTGLGAGQKRE